MAQSRGRRALQSGPDARFLTARGQPAPSQTPSQLLCVPTALSGHQHRHAAGEKHTKETGGKGKKNRNLKIGKITVSEKWRESVFRKITNANELKYLDEFLLNKVSRTPGGAGRGGLQAPRYQHSRGAPHGHVPSTRGAWCQLLHPGKIC